MLTVRLQRVGRKNDPSYRMVIIDSKRGVKSADYVENVGTYNPRQKGNTKINGERVKHWMSVGAKPTDTVHNLLISQKIIEGKKVNPLGKKTPIVKEKSEEETKAEEAPKEEVADDATDAPVEETKEEVKEEASAEEEKTEEAPVEEKKEAKPEAVDNSSEADSAKAETEEAKEEATAEDTKNESKEA